MEGSPRVLSWMRAIIEFIPSIRPEVSRYRKKFSTCCACLESVFAKRLNGFRVDASANDIHSLKAVAHLLKLRKLKHEPELLFE